jgi:hypothetical protein
MHKITSALVGVSLSTLVLSGCAAGIAGASVGLESPSDSPRVESATEATSFKNMSDVEALAFDELAKAQGPLGIAVGEAEEQFPADFAYTFFDGATLHVGFKAEAPEDAVALLEATGGSYVLIEKAGFNAAELQDATDKVSEQTRKYVSEERSVTIGQDPTLDPTAIVVQFHADDKKLTEATGLADSLDVDAPFRVVFAFTETSGDFEFFE